MKSEDFKKLLKECVIEVLKEQDFDTSPEMLSRERGDFDEPPDPQDSVDDFAGDHANDLKAEVEELMVAVDSDNDLNGKAFQRLRDIYNTLSTSQDSSTKHNPVNPIYSEIADMLYNKYFSQPSGAPEKFMAESGKIKKSEFIKYISEEVANSLIKKKK